MSEQFQLVFRGECLEGYQQNEVMIELEQRLGLSAEQVEALFGPRPVVVKRAVSREEAARFQALFRSAGAHLRVLAASAPATQPSPAEDDRRQQRAAVASSDGDRATPAASDHSGAEQPSGIDAPDFDLAPAGSELPQQPRPEAPDVDVSNLSLAEPGAELETVPKRPVSVPDLSHLQLEPADRDQHS